MKLEEFFQSTKRFTAALVLSCFLLVGVAGVKFASNHHQEAPTYSESAEEVALFGPIRITVPSGNFWSG